MIDNTPWLLEYRPGEWYGIFPGKWPSAAPAHMEHLTPEFEREFHIVTHDPHNENDPILRKLVARAKRL